VSRPRYRSRSPHWSCAPRHSGRHRALLGGRPIGIEDFSTPLPFLILFTAAWLYHRAIVRREGRAPETAPQATARRLYSYLSYLAGLAAAAIGAAGVVGVAGSAVLSDNTHGADEIAL